MGCLNSEHGCDVKRIREKIFTTFYWPHSICFDSFSSWWYWIGGSFHDLWKQIAYILLTRVRIVSSIFACYYRNWVSCLHSLFHLQAKFTFPTRKVNSSDKDSNAFQRSWVGRGNDGWEQIFPPKTETSDSSNAAVFTRRKEKFSDADCYRKDI